MSRIGKKPVAIPSGVTATVSGQKVTMKGSKGELSFTVPEELKVEKTADGDRIRDHEMHVLLFMVSSGLYLQMTGVDLYRSIDHGVIRAELPRQHKD